MHQITIDLASDTKTKPTSEMRQAIATAEVGDEQAGEDPTVNRLTKKVCELLGKEAAIFLPSGTMCNQIAWRVWLTPGDEIIMDKSAHTFNFETGGPSALSGASINTIHGRYGIFTLDDVKKIVRTPSNYFPRSRAILIEQTSNLGGGSVWPLEKIQSISDYAKSEGLIMHMDGARLFNACVVANISAQTYAQHFDSLWIDFSKGLGAPVGAALAGSEEFIKKAWRWKHQFGGAMRQAGIIAAGALYGLNNHIDRLTEDHINAKTFAKGLSKYSEITVDPVETNIIFFDVGGLNLTAQEFDQKLMKFGARCTPMGNSRVRAVTHLDVSAEQIEEVLGIIDQIVSNSNT